LERIGTNFVRLVLGDETDEWWGDGRELRERSEVSPVGWASHSLAGLPVEDWMHELEPGGYPGTAFVRSFIEIFPHWLTISPFQGYRQKWLAGEELERGWTRGVNVLEIPTSPLEVRVFSQIWNELIRVAGVRQSTRSADFLITHIGLFHGVLRIWIPSKTGTSNRDRKARRERFEQAAEAAVPSLAILLDAMTHEAGIASIEQGRPSVRRGTSGNVPRSMMTAFAPAVRDSAKSPWEKTPNDMTFEEWVSPDAVEWRDDMVFQDLWEFGEIVESPHDGTPRSRCSAWGPWAQYSFRRPSISENSEEHLAVWVEVEGIPRKLNVHVELPAGAESARELTRESVRRCWQLANTEDEVFERYLASSRYSTKIIDYDTLERVVAQGDGAVTIVGGSGTGKERVARLLHRSGKHYSGDDNFAVCNCAAASSSLVVADLVGHTRGAFSGAANMRLGAFLRAAGARISETRNGGKNSKTEDESRNRTTKGRGRRRPTEEFIARAKLGRNRTTGAYELENPRPGTLFLDEIADLPAEGQGALLRILDGYGFRPLGWDKPEPICARFRIICATRNVEKLLDPSFFRQDLRARLDTWVVRTCDAVSHDVPTALVAAQYRLREMDEVAVGVSDDESQDEAEGESERTTALSPVEFSVGGYHALADLIRSGTFDGIDGGNMRGVRAAVERAWTFARTGDADWGGGRTISADHIRTASDDAWRLTRRWGQSALRRSVETLDKQDGGEAGQPPNGTSTDAKKPDIDADISDVLRLTKSGKERRAWATILRAIASAYGDEKTRELIGTLRSRGSGRESFWRVLEWAWPGLDESESESGDTRRCELIRALWTSRMTKHEIARAYKKSHANTKKAAVSCGCDLGRDARKKEAKRSGS